MNELIKYLPTIIQVISTVVVLTLFFARIDKKLCLQKQTLDNIEKHLKETNGKVAEVVKWKLKNQDFVEELKDNRNKIFNNVL